MAGPDVVAGRFALCDPLARGAAGTVWRAWDLRREAWCAAKVLRQRDGGDLLRFAREQSVRLNHPRLLTPYSWAAEDAHVVIVSPLVAGGSLHTLTGDHGALAPDVVADLLDQLLDGLGYVHEAGIVHRDVTPANVLLEATGDGRPALRLADFGLAVRAREPRLTRLGTVLGTPGYVPPEVLAGAAPAPAADLYAAGRVAIALLSGADPDGPADPPVRPGRLRDVIAALVDPDPGARPVSAAAARLALAPVRPADHPATAAGDPVTVLDQLPPLPPTWSAPTPPTPARLDVTSAPTRPLAAGPASTVRTPVPPPTGPAGPTHPAPPAIPPPAARVRGGRGRRRRWIGAVAVGVLVAGGAAAALAWPDGDAPGGGSNPSPSGVPVVTGPAAAGAACGWQQEGDTATDAAGDQLRCVRTAGGYTWLLS